MKDFAHAATEGFVGSFVLAGAIVVAIAGGLWRTSVRMVDAFVHDKPLPVAPGKTVNLP